MNEIILKSLNTLFGASIRVREHHWSVGSLGTHNALDEYREKLDTFIDDLVEISTAIEGRQDMVEVIKPTEVSKYLNDLCPTVRGILVGLKNVLDVSSEWAGLVSKVDDFLAETDKMAYLLSFKG